MIALIINLNSATTRMEFQINQLNSLGINFERIEAIDGNLLDDEFFKDHSSNWERPLRKSEVACCLSHRLAWDKILKDKLPYLVIEDDAILHEDTKDILHILYNNQKLDCVNLETRNRQKIVSRKKISIHEKYNLSKIIHNKSGAAAYILWPSGALILNNYLKDNGVGLADAIITNCEKLRSFQIEPAIAVQIDCCEKYQITTPIKVSSSINNSIKPNSKKIIFFRYKRFISQLKIGLKILINIFVLEKKNIPFSKKN